MLIQKCIDYDIETHVLDPNAEAPCAPHCDRFVQGSFREFDTVYRFGKEVDVLTIEIEDVNVEALERLAGEGVQVFPQPEVIRTIQDKGLQKEFYRENGIPTADFELTEDKAGVEIHKHRMPFVQKLRAGGYDGRGVQKIYEEQHMQEAFNEPSVVEQLVDVEKEISVIVARDQQGKTLAYDPVELLFHPEKNLVEYLMAPARLTQEQVREAIRIARVVAQKLNLVGLLAVEMFVDKNNQLLVNESAPRPHNSGHHTIEACHVSQYEQLLRAILGLPLGNPQLLSPAVMINLLGAENHSGQVRYLNLEQALQTEGAKVHLYGKKETRPYRKMGHISVLDGHLNGAMQKAKELYEKVQVVSED